MKRNWLTIGVVAACSLVDAPGVRAACVEPRWRPVPEGIYSFSVQGLLTANGGVRVTGRQQQCGRPVTVTFKIGDHGCLSHV